MTAVEGIIVSQSIARFIREDCRLVRAVSFSRFLSLHSTDLIVPQTPLALGNVVDNTIIRTDAYINFPTYRATYGGKVSHVAFYGLSQHWNCAINDEEKHK